MMRILIVGLGSMGKRRVRNLIALGHINLAGYDPRPDRRAETLSCHSIDVFESFDEAISEFNPEVMIISTDPSLHMDYAMPAAANGIHCFIEASVVEADRVLELANIVKENGVIVVPSCTMRYFPGPIAVREILLSGKIGKPLNFNYHTGQYLPDWHPWENIQDFYVSRRETGGAREIVTFELTWLNEIFGTPNPLACVKSKISDMTADIDDIYHVLFQYPNELLGNVTVEVISRPKALRELHVLGSKGRLVFSGDENCVRYISVGDADWTRIDLNPGTIEQGYINPEEPYIAEMKDFLKSVSKLNRNEFPNSLEKDAQVLSLLTNLESFCKI